MEGIHRVLDTGGFYAREGQLLRGSQQLFIFCHMTVPIRGSEQLFVFATWLFGREGHNSCFFATWLFGHEGQNSQLFVCFFAT